MHLLFGVSAVQPNIRYSPSECINTCKISASVHVISQHTWCNLVYTIISQYTWQSATVHYVSVCMAEYKVVNMLISQFIRNQPLYMV